MEILAWVAVLAVAGFIGHRVIESRKNKSSGGTGGGGGKSPDGGNQNLK